MRDLQQRIDDTMRAHGWIVVDSGPSDNRSHLNMSHIPTHKEKLMTDKQWEEALNWDGTNLKPAPTTEQLAREFAEHVMSTTLERIDPVQRAAAEYILAHAPKQTMADVAWDHEKHYLAGAHLDVSDRDVVMLGLADGYIVTATAGRDDPLTLSSPGGVTPNGKRYKLVEDVEPDHPATLTTKNDYWDAPRGTVVVTSDASLPMVKRWDQWYVAANPGANTH